MSELTIVQGQSIQGADEATRAIRRELTAAREDRKRMEPTWQQNLAFAAGKFWLKWHRDQRKLVFPTELQGRELYTADVITEYRTTALGEMGTDDDRPELLLRKDDQLSEDFQEQLNKALSWAWDYEFHGDSALEDARRLCLDLGTSAIRCRFDPTAGPVIAGDIPHMNGVPIRSSEEAMAAMSNGPNPQIQMKSIHQGRICWEPLSAFNLIVPPGFPNERDFPWECVVRPVPLASLATEYGDVAGDIREDTDIGSLLGLDTQAETADTMGLGYQSDSKTGRMKGHVWLYTYYEKPTVRYADGRTITFAGGKMKPVKYEERLPYVDPNGERCSGISYFHWWRVTGRFWSRALVESMKDVQRSINKRQTQINDIIDRGLPAVFMEKNSKAKQRKGFAAEILEIGAQERQPTIFPGINPGPWMREDIEAQREHLEHATGIRGPRLGENPINVTTYAQLALLNENDMVKRSMIRREHTLSIAKLVEASVYDIRTYWGEDRQLAITDDENFVDAVHFNSTKIPTFFIVKVAKGATKPRSQAAELKKIEDLWAGANLAGVVAMNPPGWIEWLKSSLEQGQALDLPESGFASHEDRAEWENSLLLAGGPPPPVMYFDDHPVHIEVHRALQFKALETGETDLWSRVELHVQNHVLTAQTTAQTMQSMMPAEPTPEEMGGAPPGAPPPGPPPGP